MRHSIHMADRAVCPVLQGIRWVLEYYYRGVVSWDWFYPHHYAPMVSDMTGLQHIRVSFNPGEPFCPFQQLLAVLPAASSKLLPSAYQVLPSACTCPCLTSHKNPVPCHRPLY